MSFSDPKEKGNEYSTLWVNKTFIVTAEPLPSLSRRVEVRSPCGVGLRHAYTIILFFAGRSPLASESQSD